MEDDIQNWHEGLEVPHETPRAELRPEPRTWRFEKVTVRNKPQNRYRDLKTGRFIKKPF